jgi:hypothetical protein
MIAATMTIAAARMSTAPESRVVFAVGIMVRIAYVAASIPRLVSLEMIERLNTTPRRWASVTMTRIVAVIDVAVKAVRAMKPWASSKEYSAGKPIRPIVAVGSAVVGGIVEVSIGAYRGYSNVDGNLRGGSSGTGKHCNAQCRECEYLFPVGHIYPPRSCC